MAKPERALTFVSEDTGVDRGEFAVTVGFARDLSDEDSDDAILVQRSADPDEDEPGIAGVYVEIPPQRHAAYGGISSAVLARRSFEIRFTSEGAAEMGGYSAVIARFDVDDKAFAEIREGLRFVFRGCSVFEERT
jgi:hypothetical protein